MGFDLAGPSDSIQTAEVPAKVKNIGTLRTKVPAAWTNAYLEMASVSTTGSVAGCTDPVFGSAFCAPDPVGHQYIVTLKDNVTDPRAVAQELTTKVGGELGFVYERGIKGFSAVLPPDAFWSIWDSRVQFISQDRIFQLAADSSNGVSRAKAPVTGSDPDPNTGAGVTVAILDSGIDSRHSGLSGKVTGGKDCSSPIEGSYTDDVGHGTQVAGVVAANHTASVSGMAPGVNLWSVKILGPDHIVKSLGIETGRDYPRESSLLCGIDHLTGLPIKVANISATLSGKDDGQRGLTKGDPLNLAISRAIDAGITVVAAAGNQGVSFYDTFVPADYKKVISVTALTDLDGQPCGDGGNASIPFDGPRLVEDDTYFERSNYPRKWVNLEEEYPYASEMAHTAGAPGVAILTTDLSGLVDGVPTD